MSPLEISGAFHGLRGVVDAALKRAQSFHELASFGRALPGGAEKRRRELFWWDLDSSNYV